MVGLLLLLFLRFVRCAWPNRAVTKVYPKYLTLHCGSMRMMRHEQVRETLVGAGGGAGLARLPKLSHVFVCQKFLKNVAVCIFNKTSNFCATCNALQCSRRRFSSVSSLSFEILCHETFLACSDNKELGDVCIHVPALAIRSHTHRHTDTHSQREILLAS